MNFFDVLTWRDILDIASVTFLFYQVLILIRGTRAFSALAGLAFLVAIYYISQRLVLYTLGWLLENLFRSLFLVIVILFHADIRQALSALATKSFWSRKRSNVDTLIDELIWVCQYFARTYTGALIVLEKQMLLGDMMSGGVRIDAQFSKELLMTIFFHNTALHDGATILRKGRIAAAGCILPLAQVDEHQQFGTRHRAALGLSEHSDATILVVSEERGEISMAANGQLNVMRDMHKLKEILRNAIK